MVTNRQIPDVIPSAWLAGAKPGKDRAKVLSLVCSDTYCDLAASAEVLWRDARKMF